MSRVQLVYRVEDGEVLSGAFQGGDLLPSHHGFDDATHAVLVVPKAVWTAYGTPDRFIVEHVGGLVGYDDQRRAKTTLPAKALTTDERAILKDSIKEKVDAPGQFAVSHGALTGLEKDDHPQYLLRAEANPLFLAVDVEASTV